jgi:hypothetical protein
MQKLSKLMLVAVAAIALATPAMAWDFKAAGSVEAHFHMKTAKASSADDITSSPQTFTGTSGAITLVSAQTDGDKSLTFTYKLDYDGGIDETVTLAAENKVGGWTASGTATQYKVSNANGTTYTDATTDGDASVTLTDGTMTHKLGKEVHLAGPTKGTLSDAVGGGVDAKANVDTHQGYSLGYKVNDTLTATLAIDMSHSTAPKCFGGTAQPVTVTGESMQATCFGVNVDGSAGDIAYGFSFGTGSASDDDGTRGASGSSSVMGLAVSMVIGEGTIAFDYATEGVSGKDNSSDTTSKTNDVEMELSYKHTLDADSHVVINFGTKSLETTTAATADKPTNTTGLELGYSTKVGDVTLAAGYGSSSVSDANDTSGTAGTGTNGKSDTDIGVKLLFSF